MDEQANTKCPICQIDLKRNEQTGDLECSMCERKWYPCEVEGEPGLAMRPRKVRVDFRELVTGGDMLKAIRPAEKITRADLQTTGEKIPFFRRRKQ